MHIQHGFLGYVAKGNRKDANGFLKKTVISNHNQIPRVINVDENQAYPPAIDKLNEAMNMIRKGQVNDLYSNLNEVK